MVDIFDPDRVKSVGGIISKGVDRGDDGVNFTQLSHEIEIFYLQRKYYPFVVQQLLVLWWSWFHQRTCPFVPVRLCWYFDCSFGNARLAEGSSQNQEHFEHREEEHWDHYDIVGRVVDGDPPDFNLALRKEEFVGSGEPESKFSQNSQACDQEIQQNQDENNRFDLLLEVAPQQSAFIFLYLLADFAADVSSLVGSWELVLPPLTEGVLNAL